MASEDDPGLHPGEIIRVGRAASVQFGEPILVRVIRLMKKETGRAPAGWCWLEVFQLNTAGDATDVRELFVQPAGLHRNRRPPQPAGRNTNERPVRQHIRYLNL